MGGKYHGKSGFVGPMAKGGGGWGFRRGQITPFLWVTNLIKGEEK